MRTVFDRHKLAWKYFYPEGNGKAKNGYCLHHKDETLRHENPERYEEWNPEDLVMITSAEHAKLHHTGMIYSEEIRKKMSDIQRSMSAEKSAQSKKNWENEDYRRRVSEGVSKTLKGREPWNKGKHGVYSEDTIRKLSEANIGRPSPNKGKKYTEEERKAKSERMKIWYENYKATHTQEEISNAHRHGGKKNVDNGQGICEDK